MNLKLFALHPAHNSGQGFQSDFGNDNDGWYRMVIEFDKLRHKI